VRVGRPMEGFFEQSEVLLGPQRKDLLFELCIELID